MKLIPKLGADYDSDPKCDRERKRVLGGDLEDIIIAKVGLDGVLESESLERSGS